MAGDWLKFEIATPNKEEVWSIAEALGLEPDSVVGKLLRVWIWFDQHTKQGNARSVSKKLLDREVGVNGFCDAMIYEGWMLEDDGQIELVNFDRHNGKTAKNRALTAKRVSNFKKSNDPSNADSTSEVTDTPLPNALPREEKRILNKKTKQKKFVKPTVDEVRAFCKERGNSVDAESFVNNYESKGWMVGKSPMKCWQSAVRTWERNQLPVARAEPAYRDLTDDIVLL